MDINHWHLKIQAPKGTRVMSLHFQSSRSVTCGCHSFNPRRLFLKQHHPCCLDLLFHALQSIIGLVQCGSCIPLNELGSMNVMMDTCVCRAKAGAVKIDSFSCKMICLGWLHRVSGCQGTIYTPQTLMALCSVILFGVHDFIKMRYPLHLTPSHTRRRLHM